jgi:hypothetical protein
VSSVKERSVLEHLQKKKQRRQQQHISGDKKKLKKRQLPNELTWS